MTDLPTVPGSGEAADDAPRPLPSVRRLWVGTYPDEDAAPGSGEGVWHVEIDVERGRFGAARQVVSLPAPSFVALGPGERTMYAVSETEDGALTALRVAGETLEPLATVPTGGSFPCHVLVVDGAAWVANYGSGGFTTVPLGDDGTFAGAPSVAAGRGSGPVADRQEGPHAHFAAVAPDGAAWVVDLGADTIRRYVVGTGAETGTGSHSAPAGDPDDDPEVAVALPPGTGPRHLVVAPAGTPGAGYAFVVGELDARVHVLELATDDDGRVSAAPVAAVPACTTPGRPETGSFPSHVALSPDGARLYVAVRGPDVLATFAVERTVEHTGDGTGDGTGEGTVRLTHLADSPLVAVWPRHFAVLDTPDGDVVVVAGQSSSTLSALRVDPATGVGDYLAGVALPSPACVVERRILEG